MKLKLQVKLLLFILLAAFVVYIVSAFYLNFRSARTNDVIVTRNIRGNQSLAALKIKSSLNNDIYALRALASSVSGTDILSEEERVEIYKAAANSFLNQNPAFDNVKISWEMNLINPDWTKNYGRRVYVFERGDGSTRYVREDLNMEGDDFSSNYYKVKINGREQITEIVSQDPDNPSIKPVYQSTVMIPVMDAENNFCALVSGGLEVETFNSAVKNSVGYENYVSFLMTDKGQFAGVSTSAGENDKSGLMKIIATSFYELKNKIDSSGFAKYPVTDSTGRKLQICGIGVDNSIFDSKWFLISAIPQKSVSEQADSQLTATILIILAGLTVLGFFIFMMTSGISSFLDKAGSLLKQFAVGKFQSVSKIEQNSTEELDVIASSLNDLKAGLDKAVVFAEEIGRGNLDAPFTPLSDNDELGSSLLSMRDSLKKARVETDERQELDRKQNWITEGTAKFGDILREYNNDMFDFSFNIISNLVKYVGANQGGLFVINDDDKDNIYFELTAGYAYNIRKILKKQVKPGVGLIGRCILESDSIYISNLPEDYINITSGLGEKSPQYLLIVPFKFNNEIYAVAEIASFNEIEPYKQQFVEEVGNSIASTIATVKINIRTNKLLQELKIQSEELASQEEEMRQNMEEMKATQEDMTKRTDEFTQTNEILNQIIMLVEYTPEGSITDVNSSAMEFFKKTRAEIVNLGMQPYETLMSSEKTDNDEFWLQLRLGRIKSVNKTVRIGEEEFTIKETYGPVQNYYGKIYKVVCLISEARENMVTSNAEQSGGGEFF